MSDEEFEILDELYFVTAFDQLLDAVNLDTKVVVSTLGALYAKGWIRVLKTPEEEIMGAPDIKGAYDKYMYLASKKGLLAHNSN